MFWQIVNLVLTIGAVGFAFYMFYKAVYHRYLYVSLGAASDFKQISKGKWQPFVSQVFGQKRLLKDKKSGVMHIVIFYGFIILQFGALDLIWKGFSKGGHLPLPAYEWFVLLQELTVVSILVAMGYATYRRYIEKLPRLKRGWRPSIVIFFIYSLMLSVIFSLSFERIWLNHEFSWLAPITSFVASLFIPLSESAAAVLFYISWWAHLLILLAFLIYIPQSKHFHLITAPINIYLRKKEPVGRLTKLDLEVEEAESFGVGSIEQFTQEQMLDFYACVECGRCTNVCPASNTGKALSPMHLITKLRDHLTDKGAELTGKMPYIPEYAFKTNGAYALADDEEIALNWDTNEMTSIQTTLDWQKRTWKKLEKPAVQLDLIGHVMSEEEIWSCTTCRNCEDQCPVANEHVDKIVDLRRHLVLMQGNLPQEGQRAMQNIERQSNPWGLSRNDRDQWTGEVEGMKVPTVKDNPQFEYLFFVGSMGSYDLRSRKITKSFVRLLHESGISFAILGNEEKNSGDTPRRMGNEMLFQQLCMENITTFEKYGVRKIVTTCPHTFNTLKNEYPDFGMDNVEVYHHSELLDKWVREGRLTPRYEVREKITYHDSCYLGRYNEIYEQPRNVLRTIPGIELVEPERSMSNGMCCGAGGGMMWMEETAGKRINVARTEQLMETKPTTISSACPYCLTMVEDGTKTKEEWQQVKARDIAELLAQSIFGDPSNQVAMPDEERMEVS